VGGGKNPLDVPDNSGPRLLREDAPARRYRQRLRLLRTDESSAGASLYITGLQNASTGKDLFYFEIPLAAK